MITLIFKQNQYQTDKQDNVCYIAAELTKILVPSVKIVSHLRFYQIKLTLAD